MDKVRNEGLEAVIIQPSGLIGPWCYSRENLIQFFVEVANEKLPATVNAGCDFVDVRDVAAATIRACIQGRCGQNYILSNRTWSMKQLGLMIAAANHFQPTRLTVPLWLASAATPFTALYYRLVDKEPLYTKIALETIESNSDFDNSKAVRDLDFHPRLMQETVTDTVAFLQSIFRIDQNRILARPALRTRKVSPAGKARS